MNARERVLGLLRNTGGINLTPAVRSSFAGELIQAVRLGDAEDGHFFLDETNVHIVAAETDWTEKELWAFLDEVGSEGRKVVIKISGVQVMPNG